MRFLVSVPSDMSSDGKWTTRREPVVPCFPSQADNAFLSATSFLLAHKAEVADIDDDPDALAENLAAEYPGLPRKLHENYVMETFKAALSAPVGSVFRIAVGQSQATLINEKTAETTILWDKQPL